MKAKIMPYNLEEVRRRTHDYEFAADPSLTIIHSVDRVEAKDCLDFHTRQFESIMAYLLQTDRQLKEYMDILEEMGLSDE